MIARLYIPMCAVDMLKFELIIQDPVIHLWPPAAEKRLFPAVPSTSGGQATMKTVHVAQLTKMKQ